MSGVNTTLSYIGSAISDWFNLLNGPPDPPFSKGASFDTEWNHFFTLLSTSAALTAATLGIDSFFAHSMKLPLVPLPLTLKVITGFTIAAVLYRLYAKLFRISITPKQSFFCFSFCLLPFTPLLAALRLMGSHLHFLVFFLSANLLVVYIVVVLIRTISRVTGSGSTKVSLSIVFALLIVCISVAT